VDWVFNAAPVLKERAAWMALNEELTCSWDAVGGAPYAQKSIALSDRITDTLSKEMVRKVKNRWGEKIWPWDREGFKRTSNRYLHRLKQRHPLQPKPCLPHPWPPVSARHPLAIESQRSGHTTTDCAHARGTRSPSPCRETQPFRW
jgi:hypothetical protein